MEKTEIKDDYEKETGNVIIESFRNLDYKQVPGVLVNKHGKDVYYGQ